MIDRTPPATGSSSYSHTPLLPTHTPLDQAKSLLQQAVHYFSSGEVQQAAACAIRASEYLNEARYLLPRATQDFHNDFGVSQALFEEISFQLNQKREAFPFPEVAHPVSIPLTDNASFAGDRSITSPLALRPSKRAGSLSIEHRSAKRANTPQPISIASEASDMDSISAAFSMLSPTRWNVQAFFSSSPSYFSNSISNQPLSRDVVTPEKNKILDLLFKEMLSLLKSVEVPSQPSLFIVYAHNCDAAGEAKAEIARYLIEQLSELCVKLYSDQTPLAQPYSGLQQAPRTESQLEDILISQLGLLPTSLRRGIHPVDKVVVCCSEVLAQYLKWAHYPAFYEQLQAAYDVDVRQQSDTHIREVVKAFYKKDGFHHVLTEIAFLQIRAKDRGDAHGIIPVELTANSHEPYLDLFMSEATVRIGDIPRLEWQAKAGQPVYQNEGRHAVLLKLIERLLARSDMHRTALSQFWQEYSTFMDWLKLQPASLSAAACTERINHILNKVRTALEEQRLRPHRLSLTDLRTALYQSYKLSDLSIQRVSGDKMSLADCYINLAMVESQAQREKDKEELKKQAAVFERLPSSELQRLEAANPNKLIALEKLFEAQKLRDGSEGIPKRILIQGRAGIGKTTLCKKLVYEYYRNGLWQDIFDSILWVPLRRLKTASQTTSIHCLEDLLCHRYFSNHGNAEAQALGKTFLDHQNKTLFILDGLDEVTEMFSENHPLNHFLKHLLNQSYVLITSRPAGVNSSQCNELDLELETIGFNTENVQTYIQKFAPESKQAEIQQFIDRTPLIQSLVNIPIQLDALCYSWNSLPKNQTVTMASLYEAMVSRLWSKDSKRLEKRKSEEKLIAYKLKERIAPEENYLSYLAFKGLEAGKIEFSWEDLSICEEELYKTGGIDTDTYKLKATSFLHTADAEEADEEKRSYHFLHLTFQEFFAAKFLARHLHTQIEMAGKRPSLSTGHAVQTKLDIVPSLKELEAFIATHKYHPRYEIVWWMVSGLLKGSALEYFFTLLEEAPRDLIGIRHQQVMMGCLNEARTQLKTTTRTELEKGFLQWLDFEIENGRSSYSCLGSQRVFPEYLLLDSLNQAERKKKNKVIATFGERPVLSPDALQVLISSLKDDDEGVRDAAARALGRQSTLSLDAIQALISTLKDEDGKVRDTATWALDSHSKLSSYVVQALISFLKDEDLNVRDAAARALGSDSKLSSYAVQALISSLKDEDGKVRDAATRALGSHSELSFYAVQALISFLKDEDWEVRYAVARALGSQSTLSTDEVQALLVSSLKDNHKDVRDAAAGALYGQHTLSTDAVQTLVSSLKDDDEDVRYAAARALGNNGKLPTDALQALIFFLKDECKIRCVAAGTLDSQNTQSSDVLQVLITSMKDDDENVRYAAARALGGQSMLSADAVQALISSLKDDDEDVKYAAARALEDQHTLSTDAVQVLVSSLKDDDEDVRYTAASALENQRTLSTDAVQALVSSLKDNHKCVRYAAASALGSQRTLSTDVVQALVSLLKDDDEGVRYAAAGALENQRTLSTDAVQALIFSLKDKNVSVRCQAEMALGGQSTLSPDAIQALISFLKDGDKFVREAATSFLETQSTLSTDAVQALISSLKDDDKDVRYETASALGAHTNQLFTLLARLERDQVEALYAQVLFPYSCEQIAPLYIQNKQLHFYTPTGLGRPIPLTSKEIQEITEAFKTVQAEAGIISRD